MIYSVVLANLTSRRKIASVDYWIHKVSTPQLKRYLSTLAEMKKQSDRLKYKAAVIDDDFKFFSRECGDDHAVVFVTDVHEPDGDIVSKINRVARSLRSTFTVESQKHVKKNILQIVDPFIQSRFVIALVGESGVGKTSLLHLLMGKQPPEEHHPTIAINTEIIENIRFANYEIMIFDFAGQEQSRKMWDFSSTNMIFLITDSTLKNLIATKGIMSQINKDYPNLPVIIFANKQDLPNALDPSAISKIMGIDVESMVAVDLAYRNNLLSILAKLFCGHFGLDVPDVSLEDLLIFNPE
ncbi:MAG: GTP-binding protein [Candidatus Thorarchaeota archaeon]|nr:GTP-binding protein [Candidatus Thorarchaeota archaeon]